MITPLRIEGRGVGKARANFAVDLTTAPDGIIVIHGENGAGKSTLLETFLGAIYGKMPSQPSFVDVGKAAQTILRAVVQHDDHGEVEFLRTIAGTRKTKGQTLCVVSVNGVAVTDGKASTMDEWVEQNMPPYRVTLATFYGAQKARGDFLELDEAGKRSLFQTLTGCDRLAAVSAEASDRALATERSAAQATGALQALEQQVAQAGDTAAAVAVAEQAAVVAATTLDTAEWRLEGALQALEQAKQRVQDAKAARREIEGQRAALDQEQRAAQAEAERWANAARAAHRQHADVCRMLEQAMTGAVAAEQIPEAEERVAAMLAADVAVEEHAEKLRGAEAALRDAQKAQQQAAGVAGVYREVERERDSAARAAAKLEAVPCHGEGTFSGCPLIADAKAADAEHPALCRRLKELAPALPSDTIDRAVAVAVEGVREAQRGLQAAQSERAKLRGADATLATLREQAARLAEVPALRQAVEARHVEVVEAERQQEHAAARAAAAVDAARCVVVPALPTTTAEEEQHRLAAADVRRAQETHRTAEMALQRALDERARAEKLTRDVEQQRAKVATLQADAADWRELARVTGREGAQALFVAAAGPSLSATTNALLESCDVAGYSTEVETLRRSADGKKWLETFRVLVTDADDAEQHDYRTCSGGEQAMLQLATRAALNVWGEARIGQRWAALFLDEPSSALSPANRGRYLSMLRWAAKAAGLSKVVLVSHAEEHIAAADGTITVTRAGVTCDWETT